MTWVDDISWPSRESGRERKQRDTGNDVSVPRIPDGRRRRRYSSRKKK